MIGSVLITGKEINLGIEESRTRIRGVPRRTVKGFRSSRTRHGVAAAVCLVQLGFRIFFGSILVEGRKKLRSIRADGRKICIFLPGHKSNLDAYILGVLLYRYGVDFPLFAATKDLDFPPLNAFLRYIGAYFVNATSDRTSFAFLKEYLSMLIRLRANHIIFLEGKCSRDGRFSEPQTALLSLLLKEAERESMDDISFVPISIVWDTVPEASYMVGRGRVDRRPSKGRILSTIGKNFVRHGAIRVAFGTPMDYATIRRDEKGIQGGHKAATAVIVEKTFEFLREKNRQNPTAIIASQMLSILGESISSRSLFDAVRSRVPLASGYFRFLLRWLRREGALSLKGTRVCPGTNLRLLAYYANQVP